MRIDPLQYLSAELDAIREQGLYRQLRVLDGEQLAHASFDHTSVVNLSSNNDANVVIAKMTGGIPPHVRLLWSEVGGEYEKVAIGAVGSKEKYIG